MHRTATVTWNGTLRGGEGYLSTQSEALNQLPYSFATRFGEKVGTNPEELIGAAHAACFTMATRAELEKRKIEVKSLHTEAQVELKENVGSFDISSVKLTLTGDVDAEQFQAFEEAAQFAKDTCPVSKLLKANITLEVIEGEHEKTGHQNHPFEPVQT